MDEPGGRSGSASWFASSYGAATSAPSMTYAPRCWRLSTTSAAPWPSRSSGPIRESHSMPDSLISVRSGFRGVTFSWRTFQVMSGLALLTVSPSFSPPAADHKAATLSPRARTTPVGAPSGERTEFGGGSSSHRTAHGRALSVCRGCYRSGWHLGRRHAGDLARSGRQVGPRARGTTSGTIRRPNVYVCHASRYGGRPTPERYYW